MKQKSVLFVLAFVLMVGMGLALMGAKRSQRWSAPGVKVSEGPLSLDTGKIITTNVVELPKSLDGYDSELALVGQMELEGLPSDTTFGRRHYRATDGFETILSIVLMGSDRTSLHPPRYCIEGQGCSIQKIERASIPIESAGNYELPVSKVWISKQIDQDGQKFMVNGIYLYWYVSETSIRPEYNSSLWTMLTSLFQGKPMDRWAYVSCLSLCRPGEEAQTFDRMKSFVARSAPQFQRVSLVQSSVGVR